MAFLTPALDESLSTPNLRKPLTGLLTLRVHAVRDVDHAASSRFSRGPETYVILKVEDAVKARTKATRTDRWQDETFNIDIDKANEIELTVYDKSGDRPTPIGMLWVRISDIAEEMRRKKIETEFNASGWVSADKMEHGGTSVQPDAAGPMGSVHSPGSAGHGHPGAPGQGYADAPPGAAPPGGPVMIDTWFALEPVGRIYLSLSFGRPPLPALYSLTPLPNKSCSQTVEGPAAVRHRFEPSRCCSTEEGGGSREAGTQVRHSTILQYHALRALWRLFEICSRHAMRGLQVHLPPQVLPKSRHEVYQQGQLRDGSRRREDQPSHSSSLREFRQYFGQLVLSLRVPASFRTQECQEMFR